MLFNVPPTASSYYIGNPLFSEDMGIIIFVKINLLRDTIKVEWTIWMAEIYSFCCEWGGKYRTLRPPPLHPMSTDTNWFDILLTTKWFYFSTLLLSRGNSFLDTSLTCCCLKPTLGYLHIMWIWLERKVNLYDVCNFWCFVIAGVTNGCEYY